ncbi:MAG: hypothetical protein WCW67_06170 [Candidatus Margulisiibacteriota bacterium]|jgi:hypothetical protein
MKKIFAICLLALTLITASEAKWKAPKTSEELLTMFPVAWVATASDIKVSKAVPSKEKVLVSVDYFVAGQKEMAVAIVYEKYVSYNSNQRNWKRHGQVIKTDPRIKAEHYLVSNPKGPVQSICLSTGDTNYIKLYTYNFKVATEEKLIKLAIKVAEAMKK